jgi:hypothetical protein
MEDREADNNPHGPYCTCVFCAESKKFRFLDLGTNKYTCPDCFRETLEYNERGRLFICKFCKRKYALIEWKGKGK